MTDTPTGSAPDQPNLTMSNADLIEQALSYPPLSMDSFAALIPSAQTGEVEGLIERLEAAEVGTDELSAHVLKMLVAPADAWVEQSRFNGAWCIYERRERPRIWEVAGPLRKAPVTTSLDAALALAERVLPGWGFYLRSDKDGHGAGLSYPVHNRVTPGHVEHKHSLPLALCIAILRSTGDR